MKVSQQGAAHSKFGATPQPPELAWPPAPQRVLQRRSSGLSGRDFTVREKPPADGQPEAPQRQSACEVGPAAVGSIARCCAPCDGHHEMSVEVAGADECHGQRPSLDERRLVVRPMTNICSLFACSARLRRQGENSSSGNSSAPPVMAITEMLVEMSGGEPLHSGGKTNVVQARRSPLLDGEDYAQHQQHFP